MGYATNVRLPGRVDFFIEDKTKQIDWQPVGLRILAARNTLIIFNIFVELNNKCINKFNGLRA